MDLLHRGNNPASFYESPDRDTGLLRHYTPWGKFDSPMSAYLYDITMNVGQDDDTGDVEWQVWCALIGRRVLFTDDRGFVWSERYASTELARARFDEVQTAYYADTADKVDQ